MIKEVKIRPLSDDAEYNYKLENVIRFLADNYQVNIVVMFRGREMTHPEIGKKLLLRFIKDLENYATSNGDPVMEGSKMPLLFTPKSKE